MIELSPDDLKTGVLQLGKYPAVIAVDLSNGFTDPASPLGGNFQDVLAANLQLVSTATDHEVPVFFTTVEYRAPDQASVFRTRIPDLNILQQGSKWVEIDKTFASFAGSDNTISKTHPSAFFDTDLHQRLQSHFIDSLIITGLTTSGCVRATCVDGLQHNYVCAVVREACGDRNPESHEANLHDMHAKYGQVVDLNVALSMLKSR